MNAEERQFTLNNEWSYMGSYYTTYYVKGTDGVIKEFSDKERNNLVSASLWTGPDKDGEQISIS